MRWDERVIKYLKFYRDSPSGRAVAKAWAKKSGKYVKALRAELGKAGLPSDLVWLSPVIESGHNPEHRLARGRRRPLAVHAGRRAHLRSRYRSLIGRRATRSGALDGGGGTLPGDLVPALRQLGPRDGVLQHGLRRPEPRHSQVLEQRLLGAFAARGGVALETSLYVPKIVATAIMMNNPNAFGIGDVAPEPPESFDTVCGRSGHPARRRRLAPPEVSIEAIEVMNPQYLAGRTPPSAPGQRLRAIEFAFRRERARRPIKS